MRALVLLALLCAALPIGAVSADFNTATQKVCTELASTRAAIDEAACRAIAFTNKGFTDTEGRPILVADIKPEGRARQKVLVIAGVHGDEAAAFDMGWWWQEALSARAAAGMVKDRWRVLPVLNVAGLIANTRTNQNRVDINRNFAAFDGESVHRYWRATGSEKRRYPGNAKRRELETQAIIKSIRGFYPDIIISIHSPYKRVDFDGPYALAPTKLGGLKRGLLPSNPGAFANYAWRRLGIPVLTIEADTTIAKAEFEAIFADTLAWLDTTAKVRS